MNPNSLSHLAGIVLPNLPIYLVGTVGVVFALPPDRSPNFRKGHDN